MPRRQALGYRHPSTASASPPGPGSASPRHARDPPPPHPNAIGSVTAPMARLTAGTAAAPSQAESETGSARRPPRRRRDDLSDDDDQVTSDTVHIRKWIRTANQDDGQDSPIQETHVEATNTPLPPPSRTYYCTAPGCPSPPSTEFPTLVAIESHIRKHHHYFCHATRPFASSSTRSSSRRCNAVFPSNHLLDLHLHQAHSPLFWAQVARGDPNLFACFVPGCRTKVDSVGERKVHVLATHAWTLDRYEEVSRQVGRGARRYLDAEDKVGDQGWEEDEHTMRADEVVDALMDLDTGHQ